MSDIGRAIFFPVTMGQFPLFTICWAGISTAVALFFLMVLGRTMFAGAFFVILSGLGFIASFTPIGSEFRRQRLELNYWQLLRFIPALGLIASISKKPNVLSMNNGNLTGLIVTMICVWSTQLTPVLRSLFSRKQKE